MPNRSCAPHGLSLVEVLIAISCLALALTGAFNVFINSSRNYTLAREEAIAQTAVSQVISDLRSVNYFEIPNYGSFGAYTDDPERFITKYIEVKVAGDQLPRGLLVSTTPVANGIQLGDRWYGPGNGVGEIRIILINDEDPVEQELGEVAGNKDGVDLNGDGKISDLPYSQVVPNETYYDPNMDCQVNRLFPRKLTNGDGPPLRAYRNISQMYILPVMVQARWWSDAGVPREISVLTFLTNRSGGTEVPPP
jgi:type II secretory pathway pseudopilin PulG